MQIKRASASDLLKNIQSQKEIGSSVSNIKMNTFNIGSIEKSFKALIKKDNFSPFLDLNKSKLRKISIDGNDYFYYQSESITKAKEVINSLDMDDKFFNHSNNKIFFLSKDRIDVEYIIIKSKNDDIIYCMKDNYKEASELLKIKDL